MIWAEWLSELLFSFRGASGGVPFPVGINWFFKNPGGSVFTHLYFKVISGRIYLTDKPAACLISNGDRS